MDSINNSNNTNNSNKSKINIFKNDVNIYTLILILILSSFIITIIFLIIATYTTTIYDSWYAAASYISIILITACFVLYVINCKNYAVGY